MSEGREFLTVPELADLLRIKERKVYDMAAAGDVPCTRATGKLLFRETEVRAWIAQNQTGRQQKRPAVFLGSHDPLLEWALRQSECGLATYLDGSSDGLQRFAAGEGLATGLHIQNSDGKGWNVDAVERGFANNNVVMIAWAERRRGLVFRENALKNGTDISRLKGRRLAMRQPKSGTHNLLERLADKVGLTDFDAVGPYRSEQDAILAVMDGTAEVAFGLEAIAHQFGLPFQPVVTEQFDLLIDRAAYFGPSIQAFLAFCGSETFRRQVDQMPGYSVAGLGTVRWNA